eukprot:TRINITY_DN27227_c0_g2_i2.p1 TRINITY_DN27227_c0_g2~~TRINITY_DN27227_c0_g2_i2.p1  ORF type:complete len:199 (+),score=37.85 TRINITY_DN27227_c0_g2_i2:56-652(+)
MRLPPKNPAPLFPGDVDLRRRGGGFGGERQIVCRRLRHLPMLGVQQASPEPVPPPLSRTPPKYQVLIGPGGVSPVARVPSHNVSMYEEPPSPEDKTPSFARRSRSEAMLPSIGQAERSFRRCDSCPNGLPSLETAPRGADKRKGRIEVDHPLCPVHCYRGIEKMKHTAGHSFQASFGKAPTGRGASSGLHLPRVTPGF